MKKKKQALDGLLATGKISQSIYEILERDLTEAFSDLESYHKSLIGKIKARAGDLERQVSTLELFLANLEIHHAAGEIDEESYNRQSQAITLGLGATKEELNEIRDLLTIVTPAEETPEEAEAKPLVTVEAEAPMAVTAQEETVEEAVTEPKPETEPIAEKPSLLAPQEGETW
ncbi:MAG: CdvA-like protein [Candidatus Bathyarchaeia archaeon]